jgi:hypothetical protein
MTPEPNKRMGDATQPGGEAIAAGVLKSEGADQEDNYGPLDSIHIAAPRCILSRLALRGKGRVEDETCCRIGSRFHGWSNKLLVPPSAKLDG